MLLVILFIICIPCIVIGYRCIAKDKDNDCLDDTPNVCHYCDEDDCKNCPYYEKIDIK